MDELVRRGWLEEEPSEAEGRRVYIRPSDAGAAGLAERGVSVPATRSGKTVAFGCTDWTERRWHLGGALGRAIVDALEDVGCIERTAGSRAVTLMGGLDRWLDR